MPPEAMIVRNSKLRSRTGSMTGWPHFLHSSVAKGAKSPEMNVLDWHLPQVTIFSCFPGAMFVLLTGGTYHGLSLEQVSKHGRFTAQAAPPGALDRADSFILRLSCHPD